MTALINIGQFAVTVTEPRIFYEWNDTQTILTICFKQGWLVSEYLPIHDSLNNQIETLDHKVSIILDATDGNFLPSGNLMGATNYTLSRFSRNIQLVVVISRSSIQRRFFEFFLQMFNRLRYVNGYRQFHWVTSLEDAYQMIENQKQL